MPPQASLSIPIFFCEPRNPLVSPWKTINYKTCQVPQRLQQTASVEIKHLQTISLFYFANRHELSKITQKQTETVSEQSAKKFLWLFEKKHKFRRPVKKELDNGYKTFISKPLNSQTNCRQKHHFYTNCQQKWIFSFIFLLLLKMFNIFADQKRE